jgi:cytochrome c oxidase accessory protein FixG
MPESSSHLVYQPAPEEEQLAGYTSTGARRWINPTVERGRYWTIRLVLAVALLLGFFLIPHISIGGEPLFFLDVAQRRFHLFGAVFHPTDNLILVAFGVTTIFTVFALTALFGRLFCGFFCPQLFLLEFVYRPIETLFEGKAAHRRYLEDLPLDGGRRLRKAGKWVVYVAVSALLAGNLMTIFIGTDGLLELLSAPGAHLPTIVVTIIIGGFLVVAMGSFRENICSQACPWGRLQTVLYDRHTRIVAYDAHRGEPRGGTREPDTGDCVDCGRCVRTCPAGIDIRKGLQMECVGCGQCVDACDHMMGKMKRAPGLVSYTSLEQLEGGKAVTVRRRLFLYGAIWTVAFSSLIFLLSSRSAAELDILRNTKVPFVELGADEIATELRFRLTNRAAEEQTFDISLLAPPEGRLTDGETSITVAPSEVDSLVLTVVVPRTVYQRGRAEAMLRVTGSAGFSEDAPFNLLGPYR